VEPHHRARPLRSPFRLATHLRLQGFAEAFQQQQTPGAAAERTQGIVFAPHPQTLQPAQGRQPCRTAAHSSSSFSIHESTANPRRTFEESKPQEFAESIRQHGLIQPISVRPNSKGFEIDDAQALEWAIVENAMRVDGDFCV
jgi:hypothetical protein